MTNYIRTDDVDVFELRSLIALKLISKKDLENFYKELARQNDQFEEAKRRKMDKQNYRGD